MYCHLVALSVGAVVWLRLVLLYFMMHQRGCSCSNNSGATAAALIVHSTHSINVLSLSVKTALMLTHDA